jgi:23S rRNA (uracil1939-C5)-methyltransferase
MGLAVGDRIVLSIQDIAFGGEGVGRLDEFVVFVPFVALGEIVEAELVEVHKRYGRAKLVAIQKPSPDRVQPACRYFTECGGCQYQHLAYPLQLRLKQKQVADLFQRIGGLNPELVAPVAPCPQPYGYRNRIMIRSQWDKFKQGLNIGFVRADNRLVVDIEECLIAEPALNEEIRAVRRCPPPKGGLKVVLRIPPSNWDVPPDSFFQNNFALLPQLVSVVRGFLKDSGNRQLADIYCGVGFFGIELADLVDSFVGLEYDRMAIQAARANAARHGRANGEFIAGKAEEKLPELLARFAPGSTTVLLDPPRKGLHPGMVEVLRSTQPSQIIYISCHPATMARDFSAVCSEGLYEVVKVIPLDMFPQTAHVECVADLRLKRPAPCP